MKAVGTIFGERAVLKLMYSAVIRASDSWRGVKVTEFEDAQLRRLQKQLAEEQRRNTSPAAQRAADQVGCQKAN
jgi:hypothetical protein